MALRVQRENVFFAFAPELTPVARVQQGEEVVLETHDCFQAQIQTEADLISDLDWSHVNPATGPLYIDGVKPGDVLKVDILEMKVGKQSSMVTIPGEGALGDVITEMETAILKMDGDELVFKNKLRVPKKPMIGVIGLAPGAGSVPNGTPGPHGGNMDCTLIGEGASVYFTASVEGGLFGAGDFHAAMGDGEIVVCGAETEGEVRVRTKVVNLKGLPTPFVENQEIVATIFSAPSVDEAVQGAIHHMSQFLTEIAGIPLNDAGMLMSLVGELKFCQVVDPEKTVRFEFPKWVMEKYGFTLE